ncbi:hypothetical protein T06_14240 [Trichinella sp. T6]|nr:hypothetical protein T06_14240 [Trichinella sp. T6]
MTLNKNCPHFITNVKKIKSRKVEYLSVIPQPTSAAT